MKEINSDSLMLGILIFVFFIAMLVILAKIVVDIGVRNAKRAKLYETKHKAISHLVDKYEKCDQTYDWIMGLLIDLGALDHKDKKRTTDLTVKFLRKYKETAEKRAAEI